MTEWYDTRVKCRRCGNPLNYWAGSPRDFFDRHKLCPKCEGEDFANETIGILMGRLEGSDD